MKQELDERKRLSLTELLIIAGVAIAATEMLVWPSERYLIRIIFWGAASFFGYLIVALAFAQLRAHAQPFDHTLVFEDAGVTLRDNLRRKSERIAWSEVQRVSISDAAFEIRFRENRQGETYLINRAKLTEEESRFLGERLIEL